MADLAENLSIADGNLAREGLETRVAERLFLSDCPHCYSKRLTYLFVDKGTPIVQCEECDLMMRNPQPSESELNKLSDHPAKKKDDKASQLNHITKQLNAIESALGKSGRDTGKPLDTGKPSLLQVGYGSDDFLKEAQKKGITVKSVDHNELGANLPAGSFDVCVLGEALENSRDPAHLLLDVHRVLKPQGVLFISLPSLDSLPARLTKERWMEFKTSRLFYFDRQVLQNLLIKAGFENIQIWRGHGALSIDALFKHIEGLRLPFISLLGKLLFKITPALIGRQKLSFLSSGFDAAARRGAYAPLTKKRQKLSVIMPVYNEAETFKEVIEQLLQKELKEIDIEVIVVESNSKDGTREKVKEYENHPAVKVILQEKPRGKGNAVREGLKHATGDFIIIQDADLEYDLNDYEILLEPLKKFRKMFVLGSRHSKGGHWKIRHFSDSVHVSTMMNFGHVFFTWLFNFLYGQKLHDPFTMFKVFRRGCLHELLLECNGFDFDCELVAKLVRRGYYPIEIPVNYESRSFAQGKKVSFFGDPPTYIKAFLKYRFSAVN